ncbi:hypothetical protein, partial [Dysosmobacter sp.]|uniref:hypothetical protein n=1 Tax=Dysosmobacter sp. TaxID=2591382 RepID=UPI002A8E525D
MAQHEKRVNQTQGRQITLAAFRLSKNVCLKQLGCILQGEYEGAGAPSCGIKCLQKACASRRLRRAAAD